LSREVLYEVDRLTKVFSTGFFRTTRIYALNNVSFNVREGEILSIVGESGSGKSTLLKVLLKALKPTSGRVLYRGVPLERWDNRSTGRRSRPSSRTPTLRSTPSTELTGRS